MKKISSLKTKNIKTVKELKEALSVLNDNTPISVCDLSIGYSGRGLNLSFTRLSISNSEKEVVFPGEDLVHDENGQLTLVIY